MRSPSFKAVALGVLMGAQVSTGAVPAPSLAAELPFERTEDREPCANFVATKQPFFGETHLHTAYSFDAVALDTRNTPADAYRYAKGERVGLPPWADTRTGDEPPRHQHPNTGHRASVLHAR